MNHEKAINLLFYTGVTMRVSSSQKSAHGGKVLLIILSMVLLSVNVRALDHELEIGENDKQAILDYVRRLVDGETHAAEGIINSEVSEIGEPVIITLFSEQGKLLASLRIEGETSLEARLTKGVKEIQRTLGHEEVDYESIYIHIMIVSYTGKFPNFGTKVLFDNRIYEPGVTGLVFELGDMRVELNPLQCLVRNFDSDESRLRLIQRLKTKTYAVENENSLGIEIYRVIHFGERFPDRKLGTYHRGHRIYTVDDVSYESISESLDLIARWYANNVINSEVTYLYNPITGDYLNSNRTMGRSTMAVWILNRLAYFLNHEELKELGRECLNYYLQRYFNMKESIEADELLPTSELTVRGEIPSNRYITASFLVAAILERDEYDRYQRQVELLMDWIMKYQRVDGFLWTQKADSQCFMPGQLLLTVAYLYERTKKEELKKFFDRSFGAYSASLQDMMHLGGHTYFPCAPAWFTQPFAKMYTLTEKEEFRDQVYMINDVLAKWYEIGDPYQAYTDFDGMLGLKLILHSDYIGNVAVNAAALESLVDACYIARLDGDVLRERRYKTIIRHSVAYLMRLQYVPENTYYIQNRDRIVGAFKYDLVDNLVWMDSVWHLTSAFIKILQFRILN